MPSVSSFEYYEKQIQVYTVFLLIRSISQYHRTMTSDFREYSCDLITLDVPDMYLSVD